MSFREQSKEAAEESSGGNVRSYDWHSIDVDLAETPWVRTQPTTFFEGTTPDEEEGNPILRFENTQYTDGGRRDQGYIAIVLDDPSILAEESEGTEDTVVLYREDKNEYRLFNESDRGTEVHEGTGIEFDPGQGERLYKGEMMDSLPDDLDRVILTFGANGSKTVSKMLDVNGGEDAEMNEDGSGSNHGLIERVPDSVADDNGDEDGFWSRFARDPELREDYRGERLGFLHERASEVKDDEDAQGYWFSVFDMESGDRIEPTTGGRPEVEDVGEDGETYPNYTYLRDEWGRYEAANSGLPELQQEFVDEWLDADQPTDEEKVREAVSAEEEDGNFEEEVQADAFVAAVRNEG